VVLLAAPAASAGNFIRWESKQDFSAGLKNLFTSYHIPHNRKQYITNDEKVNSKNKEK
jgi:hypothetical protein